MRASDVRFVCGFPHFFKFALINRNVFHQEIPWRHRWRLRTSVTGCSIAHEIKPSDRLLRWALSRARDLIVIRLRTCDKTERRRSWFFNRGDRLSIGLPSRHETKPRRLWVSFLGRTVLTGSRCALGIRSAIVAISTVGSHFRVIRFRVRLVLHSVTCQEQLLPFIAEHAFPSSAMIRSWWARANIVVVFVGMMVTVRVHFGGRVHVIWIQSNGSEQLQQLDEETVIKIMLPFHTKRIQPNQQTYFPSISAV